MLQSRLLWASLFFAIVFQGSAFAGKVKEKSPPQDEYARPAELVKIGLQAELAGNSDSRQLHLQAALDIAPEYAPANWQLGKIRVGEEWQTTASAAAIISKSPQYSLYRAKRDELDGSVKKEHLLARWCEQEGMHDRAQFHYARLLQNPGLDEKTAKEAINKLALVFYAGQLRSREAAAQLESEAKAIDAAWIAWERRFAGFRGAFEGANKAKQERAHEELLTLSDVHATPLIESHLAKAGEAWSLELIATLARLPELPATQALAKYSILSPHEDARKAAIAELKRRKPSDYIPQLLAGLTPKTRSRFLVTMGSDLSVNYQHTVELETAGERVQVNAQAASPVVVQRLEGRDLPIGAIGQLRGFSGSSQGLLNQMLQEQARQEAQSRAQSALQKAQEIEAQVALQNLDSDESNTRFFECLEQTTGQKLPHDPVEWWSWWKKYNEDQTEKPTAYYVAWYTQPMYRTQIVPTHSCFVGGTLVETEAGRKPIDSIQAGDRVLSQNLETGELAWKVVQNTSVTKLSKLRELVIGNETIVATPGHPFWVNGSGWKMAKELIVGDRIHTLQGSQEVKSNSEPAKQDTVYNLVVADFSTYFVGEVGALVRDIPFRQPTLAKVPGLVEAGK